MHDIPFYSVPVVNVLLLIYKAFASISIPYALGFSIIALTVLIRLVLYPVISSQLRATKKMQDVNPHLKKLKEKHKGDAKTLQAETMKLYKEFGINPLAGCLPLIIQLPVFWSLYGALSGISNLTPIVIAKIAYFDFLKISRPWDLYFFGLPLAKNPSDLINTIGPVILIVPILTGVFQFIQSKMMLPVSVKAEKTKDKKKDDDFATAFQKQSLYIFPIMIGFFSWTFPIGLSLYWNTFTIFGIIQQHRVSGLGGLEEWTKKIWQKKS